MSRTHTLLTLGALLALTGSLALGQYNSEVVGFNGPPIDDPPNSQEMFRTPDLSGTTRNYIVLNPPGLLTENAAYRGSGFQTEGAASERVYFTWADYNNLDSWLRLTTLDGSGYPNPSVHIDGKVRFKFTNISELFAGEVGLCIGIRETGVAVPQLGNGGFSGEIEWVGVDSTPNAIIAGADRIVNTAKVGDDVQVYPVGFSLDADPNNPLPSGTAVITPGANGILDTPPAGDDERRIGYYLDANGARVPIPAVTLLPSPTAYEVEFNLATGAVKVDGVTYPGAVTGFTGNGVLDVTPPRGVFEHIAITNADASGWFTEGFIDFYIDELQTESPEPDPVLPPTVVSPIINEDTTVTVTDLMLTVNQVQLLIDGAVAVTQNVANNNDLVITLPAPAVTGQIFTAKQRDSVTGLYSEESLPVEVYPAPAPFTFSICVDEDGNNCSPAGPWEFVPVTGVTNVGSYKVPHGTPMFPDDAVWQTVDIPFDNPDLVIAWLGGDGDIDPNPTGVYSMDSIWFSVATGAEATGPHEVLLDTVEALDAGGNVLKTIHSFENGILYMGNIRGQSSTPVTTTQLFANGSFDGGTSHRLVWTYPDLTDESLGMYHNQGLTCNTSPQFPGTTTMVRFHMVVRGQRTAPSIALPVVAGPIVGNQTSVRVTNDASATAVQLYVNGEPVGAPVTPTSTQTNFAGLTLNPGDSVSARQVVPAGESDFAYPRAVGAAPLPPSLPAGLYPGGVTVTVNGVLAAPFATASTVSVYVNGVLKGTAPGGTTSVVVNVPALMPGDIVTATQTVNGVTSGPSNSIIVATPPPTVYHVPYAGQTSLRVQDLIPDTSEVKVLKAGVVIATVPVTPGSSFVNVPVSGLVAGDVITVRQTAVGSESVDSVAETVTVNTEAIAFNDTIESYVDQNDFENAAGEVRNRGWWPSSGDPVLTLVTNRNATPGGTKSAYYPIGESPPIDPNDLPPGNWGNGWQCNFDFAYPEPDFPDLTSEATTPIIWSVNVYDSGGAGTDNLYQWAELRDYTTGSLGGLIAMGMPGSSFFPSVNNNYYSARILSGGPGYVDLNHPGAPTRTIGWHTFTAVIKPTAIDFYVDGILAKKNVARGVKPYDNLYLGSGYASGWEGWYDDYKLHKGKFSIPARLPNPPLVVSPIVAGDELVTIQGVEPTATNVTVYANGVPIGSISPAGATQVDVPVTALAAFQSITASQTTPIGASSASAALEVGQGNGDVLVTLGIRETGDTGPLGSTGGTSGPIEWIGAASTVSGAPQGKPLLVDPAWQTVTFNPAVDPILAFPGTGANGVIDGTRGVLEHLAVAVKADSPNRSSGVYAVYVDNVVNVGANGGANFVIADFEAYPAGVEVLFQEPNLSGTTTANLATPPNGSAVTDAEGSGSAKSAELLWFFRDTTAGRWVRLTTSGATNLSRPIIDITKPIRMDILLAQGDSICVGDLNCDGQVSFGDINPFVLRLSNPAVYATTYPDCPDGNGDVNGNGTVGFDDINPFVSLMSTGQGPCN